LNSSVTNLYPVFGNNIISNIDPLFADIANNDFRLLPCSPAVNAGNNLIVDTLGILTDLDGNPRIRFGTVDIGAYETQDSCFTSSSAEPKTATVRVSPNPGNPGGMLEVLAYGFENQGINWTIHDTHGRVVSFGTNTLSSENTLQIEAPKSRGIFFLEMREGVTSVWLKLVVQ